jgi:hypothetical protein
MKREGWNVDVRLIPIRRSHFLTHILVSPVCHESDLSRWAGLTFLPQAFQYLLTVLSRFVVQPIYGHI